MSTDSILKTVGSVLIAISMGLASWGLKTAAANSERLAAIEANMFETTDGLEIWKAIADLKTQIAQIPGEIPPKWLRELVRDHSAALTKIDDRLGSIEQRVAGIEAKVR